MMDRKYQRAAAFLLAAVTLAVSVVPAAAAEEIGDGVTPTYDEAYYAMMDHYGNLTEGSVVKSYTLNGAAAITDYGTYDQVVNLTDGTAPETGKGTATFRFQKNSVPSHFYFEGKTAAPFEALPWTLAISYTLNGVPARAEELAGKTGVVEIAVDAIPNENASEYAKNNYTLEAMAMFNQDDILSLEAPGAQVQLIGNLRAVLFIALPGEEQHFVIRVGSENFTFDGMTFLMVPATLSQLEEIAKLSQRKDDLEKNYNKLSGSLDTLLDSFAALGGSLRDTADGLDQLNQARDTISKGKDQLYNDGDKVLADLERLNGSLDTLPGHLEDADDAVVEVTDSLTDVTEATVRLRRNLDDVDDCLKDLQRDLVNIRTGTGSLQSNLRKVGEDLKRLQTSMKELEETLKLLDIQINGGILDEIPEDVKQHISVQGQRLSDLLSAENMAKITALDNVWKSVEKDAEGTAVKEISYQQYQIAALLAAGKAQTAEAAVELLTQVQQVDGAIAQVKAIMPDITDEQALQVLVAQGKLTADQAAAYSAVKPQLIVMEQVYIAVTGGTDQSMTKTDFFTAMLMMQDIQKAPAQAAAILQKKADYAKTAALMVALTENHDLTKVTGLLENLSALLEHMGSGGLIGDLDSLAGKADTALGHLDDAADVGREILGRVDDILAELENLDDTVNDQVPGLRDTLRDTRILVNDMVDTIGDTHGFLSSFRALAKESGGQLDEGTRQSLTSLAETLRKTARSMDATGDVRAAKGSINEIIEDTWQEYTGQVNNLLLMDATAPAESLTSPENPAPASVQVLIRSQEIKAEESAAAESVQPAEVQTTFWGRVGQMLQDFWNAVTSIFR